MIGSPEKARGLIEEAISLAVLESVENQLPEFGDRHIFDRPSVGIADGDDDTFQTFRRAVSPNHILPREILERHAPPGTDLSAVRVVSWALPYSVEVRRSNRETEWPSELYSVARNNGGALNGHLSQSLQGWLRERGYAAVCPSLDAAYDAFRTPEYTFSSTWSERHVAFAAGLGNFGLHGLLITSRGTMVRLGSLVTNLPLPVTSARDGEYRAPCLRDGGRGCGFCRDRCPVSAILRSGLDKSKCFGRRQAIRRRFLQPYVQKFGLIPSPIVRSGKREHGFSLGCALCSTAVPCEASRPQFRERD